MSKLPGMPWGRGLARSLAQSVGLARPTFRHGVHPHHHKEATAAAQVVRMPFVERYVLPLSQHIGAPARALVKKGQRVVRGEMIAEPGGFVSTALHAPVTGEVRGIEMLPHPSGRLMPSIIIETDAFADQSTCMTLPALESMDDAKAVLAQIQKAGIVGLGGAAFPMHVKLSIPPEKKVRFVILNGCECEPYLTCDHRLMLERSEAVLEGLNFMMQFLKAERGFIGVESNKLDAIEKLKALTADRPDIEVVALQTKYPEGAEKMLLDAILHKEIPLGKLPLDMQVVSNNVGTAVVLADLWRTRRPLIERVVTVTGPGIRTPRNVMVPIGTPVRDLVNFCGGLTRETTALVLGGPMMGMAQKSLTVPVLKGTSGVLALTGPQAEHTEEACIRCSRCLEACPLFLNPSRLAALSRKGRVDDLEKYHVNACFECASCSFVCPSNIPLVQLIRVGKSLFRDKLRRDKAAAEDN